MDNIIINLQELKITSYLFRKISKDDNRYREFLSGEQKPKDIIDLLRYWGCRHFAIKENEIAVNSLNEWLVKNKSRLPKPTEALINTSKDKIEGFESLYNSLTKCRASRRSTFGFVGASKALFFIRSEMFPPWDGKINNNLDFSENGKGYCEYLLQVKNALQRLKNECLTKNVTLRSLPGLLGRKHVSNVKLVDEYLYIKITRGCDPKEILKIAKNANKFFSFHLNG